MLNKTRSVISSGGDDNLVKASLDQMKMAGDTLQLVRHMEEFMVEDAQTSTTSTTSATTTTGSATTTTAL